MQGNQGFNIDGLNCRRNEGEMLVMTVDQRGSRTAPDRVPALLEALRGIPVRAPFERTVGDEVQGVPQDADAVWSALRVMTREGDWHIGIGGGAGELGPDGASRSGRGAAFLAARDAVEASKSRSPSVAVREGGLPGSERAAAVEAVAGLLVSLLQRRSEAQWQTIDLLEGGMSGQQAATVLGISPQAVSQRRLAAGADIERDGAAHLVRLLDALDHAAADEPQGKRE